VAARWFSDVDPEDTTGHPWQPCLQVHDGWCPALPAWFPTKDECDQFIRDHLEAA